MLTAPEIRGGAAQVRAAPSSVKTAARAVGLAAWGMLCALIFCGRSDLSLSFLCLTLLAAPIVEEAFFRGALWDWGGRLYGLQGVRLNIAIATLFAIAHLQFTPVSELSGTAPLFWVIGFFVASLALGIVRRQAGLIAAMTLHSMMNAIYLTEIGRAIDLVMSS